jgi:hypothetical protein
VSGEDSSLGGQPGGSPDGPGRPGDPARDPDDPEYGSPKTDEATRITRIVLVAVIVVLLGGLAALLLLGGDDDGGARDAVTGLDNSGVEIRDDTTTPAEDDVPETTETTASAPGPAPETTAGRPAGPGGAQPPPAPPPAPDAAPADLEVFFADNGSGFLPVRKGQSSTVSIRNTGGSTGFWALNATGPVRVDGASGINGQCAPGQVITIRVTIADGADVTQQSEESIRFEVSGGPTVTIPVLVLPPL